VTFGKGDILKVVLHTKQTRSAIAGLRSEARIDRVLEERPAARQPVLIDKASTEAQRPPCPTRGKGRGKGRRISQVPDAKSAGQHRDV